MYAVYLIRRIELEDRQADLENQTFNLFPERWTQLYQDKTLAGIMSMDENGGGEMPVTDIDALDQWYEQMVRSGGKQFVGGDRAGAQEWGGWQ